MATKNSSRRKSKAKTIPPKTVYTAQTVISAAAKKTIKKKSVSRKLSTKHSSTLKKTVGVLPVTDSSSAMSKMSWKQSYTVAIIAAFVILLLVYSIRSWFIAAFADGVPITRLAVIQSLEQQGGSQALQSLITQSLIKQDAARKHITVSQNDINSQMKTIEGNLMQQGQTLDSALAQQHMTRQQLEDQIVIQKMVEKLVGPVRVTDKQAQDYLDKNKDSLGSNATLAQVKQQLQQQELQQKEQGYVQNLLAHAHITYWVNYPSS